MPTLAPEKLGHLATVSPAATKAAVISVLNACRRADLQLKGVFGDKRSSNVLRVAVKMEVPVWRALHTGAHAHGAGANTYRVYVRSVRGLTLTSSGGTAGSTSTSQRNTCWCVHPLQNFASDTFSAPGSHVLYRVLQTLNNASSRSCSSISFC